MIHNTNTASTLIDIVLPDLAVTHPETALARMARATSPYISVDPCIIEQHLLALEKQEGCGIGNGVALPHLRLPGADQSIAIFARNRHWLNFRAVDDTPVDLLCILVSPNETPANHLRRLSRLTRVLREKTILSRLREAENHDVIEAILANGLSGTTDAA